MTENRSPQHNIPTVSARLPDGSRLELTYSLLAKRCSLAHDSDGDISLKPDVTFGSTKYVPISPENNLIRHGAVLLPEKPDSYESTESLLKDIQDYLHRYVDLSPAFFRIASAYVLLSWVYDAFNELPYLRLRGDYGSGKTRALLIIGSICNKPFFASGASTVSPIFHTLDMFRGTLIFDEADFRFSDEKAEIIKIFNNGNVRGFPVLRTAITQKREFDPRAFAVFGPKLVAMRREFEDRALESRFITEDMGNWPLRPDIPINLPDYQKDEAQALRNKLLMYRFRNVDRICIDESLVDPSLSPRVNQVLVPLLSVVENEDTRQGIREAAKRLERDLRDDHATEPEGDVLTILFQCIRQEPGQPISVGFVTRALADKHGMEYDRPITARYVGYLIRKRLRIRTGKSHGVYVVPAAEHAKIEALATRYGLKSDEQVVT